MVTDRYISDRHTGVHYFFVPIVRIPMDLFKKLRTLDILLIDDDEWIRDSLSIFFKMKAFLSRP